MRLPIYWKIQINNLGMSSAKSLSRDNWKSVGAAKGMAVKDMKGPTIESTVTWRNPFPLSTEAVKMPLPTQLK